MMTTEYEIMRKQILQLQSQLRAAEGELRSVQKPRQEAQADPLAARVQSQCVNEDGVGCCCAECCPYCAQALRDKVAEQAAQIRTLTDALAWQPIDIAPKDGTPFIAKTGEWGIGYCVWDTRYKPEGWATYPDGFIMAPTHWMPLPAARSVLAGVASPRQPTTKQATEPHEEGTDGTA